MVEFVRFSPVETAGGGPESVEELFPQSVVWEIAIAGCGPVVVAGKGRRW
ncbi:hypothetical protein ACFXGA_20410 [Actinosynnema sp. NPDC059335]